jgi:fatty-acid desaturase
MQAVLNAEKVADAERMLANKLKTSKTVFSAWWVVGAGIIIGHVLAAYALVWHNDVPLELALLGMLFGLCGMFGVTAGYHRHWSHYSFQVRVYVYVCLVHR